MTSQRRGPFIPREILKGHKMLDHNYFAEIFLYPPHLLLKGFYMSRTPFLHIKYALEAYN